MAGYVKLFTSILGSTVWVGTPAATKVVWITLLATSDRDGEVRLSIPGLAQFAGVSIPECEAALESFLAPDQYSSTQEHEGRRIERIDGGWRLLNHEKYRDLMSSDDRRERAAARQQRHRDRREDAAVSPPSRPVTSRNAPSHPVTQNNASNDIQIPSAAPAPAPAPITPSGSGAGVDGAARMGPELPPARAPYRPAGVATVTPQFLRVYDAYPRKLGKQNAAQVFHELAEGHERGQVGLADEICAAFAGGLMRHPPYNNSDEGKIPALERFLSERRWEEKLGLPKTATTIRDEHCAFHRAPENVTKLPPNGEARGCSTCMSVGLRLFQKGEAGSPAPTPASEVLNVVLASVKGTS